MVKTIKYFLSYATLQFCFYNNKGVIVIAGFEKLLSIELRLVIGIETIIIMILRH